MKDILIIANFCRDFSKSDNGRFCYIANELAKNDNVEIVTSDFSHGDKKYKSELLEKWPFRISFLHELGYKKNVCIKRFLSHIVWGINVKSYLSKRKKPDIVYCAVPSLSAAYWAAKYCKKNKIKFVIDIQDLWPEAYKMIFNPPIFSKIIYAPFEVLANYVYKSADGIVAVSETYMQRGLRVNTRNAKGLYAYLGTNLKIFDEYGKNSVKSSGKLVMAYCGTLGSSYNLTDVLYACKKLKERGKEIKFLIMGSGPKQKEFEDLSKRLQIDTEFTGRLDYPEMVKRLCEANLSINPIMKGAAQSIINKVGDYAAAGLPVINTQECLEYREKVEKLNIGINVNNGDIDGIANAIEMFIENDDLLKKLGANNRKFAEQCFDRTNSYKEIFSYIKGVNND